ncbi:hypothetical protein D3C73_867430 [compost metagenome]
MEVRSINNTIAEVVRKRRRLTHRIAACDARSRLNAIQISIAAVYHISDMIIPAFEGKQGIIDKSTGGSRTCSLIPRLCAGASGNNPIRSVTVRIERARLPEEITDPDLPAIGGIEQGIHSPFHNNLYVIGAEAALVRHFAPVAAGTGYRMKLIHINRCIIVSPEYTPLLVDGSINGTAVN